ncbi:PRC-barrel domain-containing protein [Paeniglutamicibacter sp.]|uniref:PRC-barrel domain-containing protein n=1 Tax=Paeniglutamicibacter sp. TaxID=1934391 RepID=UPI00398A103C
MLHNEDLQPLLETKTTVFGSDGEKIGTLGQIYLDDGTNLPHFATVHTGLFGTQENFVPLSDAEISDGQLYVKFTKHVVKDAPNIDPLGHLSPEEEDQLYDYYSQAGFGTDEISQEPPVPREREAGEPVGLVHGSPLASEEHMRGPGGGTTRPRIRKYVVSAVEADAAVSGEASDATIGRQEASGIRHEAQDAEEQGEGARSTHANEQLSEGSRVATEDGPETREPGTVNRMDP